MGDNNVKIAGPSFFTLLGVLFVGLKLTGFINWPWWVVLAPIWGPIVLVLAIWAIMLIIAWVIDNR